MGSLTHSFGRNTQVPTWTPIKHAEVFNPTLPFVMLLSFIPLGLQLLTAIWQSQALATDAMGSKGHFFNSPCQAGIDFSLIIEEHKKRREYLSAMPNATPNVTGDNMEVRTETDFKPILLTSIQIRSHVHTKSGHTKIAKQKAN